MPPKYVDNIIHKGTILLAVKNDRWGLRVGQKHIVMKECNKGDYVLTCLAEEEKNKIYLWHDYDCFNEISFVDKREFAI